jgi:hypothetical protein
MSVFLDLAALEKCAANSVKSIKIRNVKYARISHDSFIYLTGEEPSTLPFCASPR